MKISVVFFVSMMVWCHMLPGASALSESDYLNIVSPIEIETEPRDLVVTTLRINNPKLLNETYKIQVEMPDGWKTVSGDTPVEIAPNDGILRIVSFFIPGSTKAGDYTVKFKLLSDKTTTPLAEQEVAVSVKSMPQITITQLQSIETDALAGETLRIQYKAQNLGNVKTYVKFNTRISKGTTARVYPEEIELDIDEAKIILMELNLDESITQVTDITIQLQAKAVDEAEIESINVESPFHRVKVFPRFTTEIDEYYRLPGKVKVKAVREERFDTLYDYQMELSLSGALNEEKTQWVELLYRVPDRDDQMVFFSQDEHFHAAYKDEDLGIYIGDGHYGISPLIDLSRSGRGAKIDVRYDLFNLGTYYVRSVRTPHVEDILAVSLDMQFDDNNLLSFNALYSETDADSLPTHDDKKIVGIRGRFGDGEKVSADIEFAKGGLPQIEGDDIAYRISARYREGETDLHLRHIDAGPAFSGYYRDMEMTEFSGSFPIGRGLKIQTNLRNQERAFISLSSIKTVIREKYSRIGAVYSGYPGTSITLDYISKDRRGSGEFLLFDTINKYWQLGASQNIGNVTVSGRVEVGDNEDRVLGESVMHLGQHGSLSWRIDDKWSVSGFAGYRRGDGLDIYKGTSVRGGMNLRYNKDRKTIITSGVNVEVLRHLYRRVYIPFLFQHEFNSGDQIEVRARYSTARRGRHETSDTSVMVQYIFPFSIKLGHRGDIGTLTGFVRDIENDNEGIPGVLVHTMDQASLTDEHGKYTIRNLEPGSHSISVNLKDEDYNRITVPSIPINVGIEGGEIRFDIEVVTAAEIFGRIAIHEDALEDVELPDDKPEIVSLLDYTPEQITPSRVADPEIRLSDILIEIESEHEAEFRLTDENGEFMIDRLIPGSYILTIDPETIPKRYEVEQTRYEFDLEPGERYELSIQLKEKEMEIQIIKTGEELKLGKE